MGLLPGAGPRTCRGRQTMAHAISVGTRPAPRPARNSRPMQSLQPAQNLRPAPQPPLRLTRRGRIVLIVVPLFLATLAALVAWAALTAPAEAAVAPPAGPGATLTVTVQPGDSLWTIAARRVPDQDPRVTISQIQDLNGLSSGRVLPGEQILVPTGR